MAAAVGQGPCFGGLALIRELRLRAETCGAPKMAPMMATTVLSKLRAPWRLS